MDRLHRVDAPGRIEPPRHSWAEIGSGCAWGGSGTCSNRNRAGRLYATEIARREDGDCETSAENVKAEPDAADLIVALDRLEACAPKVESVSRSASPLGGWRRGLLAQTHCNIVIVALANKLARSAGEAAAGASVSNTAAPPPDGRQPGEHKSAGKAREMA